MTDTTALTLCVYCGARPGHLPVFTQAAREVGKAIASRGWRLVYGGGRSGLMGQVADAAVAAGGHVVGIIPSSLMSRELGHSGLAALHVVQTMHERKHMMAELSDAFLALPGGIGTLEELFEAWTWRQLGYHSKPLGLLNTAGYYDQLLAFTAQSCSAGFLSAEQNALVQVDCDVDALLNAIAAQCRPAAADYSAI